MPTYEHDHFDEILWQVGRRAFALLAFLLLPAPGAGAKQERGYIELHTGYGTPERLIVHGRVLEEEPPHAPEGKGSKIANLIRTARLLETDELSDRPVVVRFEGRRLAGRTDREGFFTIEMPAGEEPFPTGRHPFRVGAQISAEVCARMKGHAVIYPASMDRVVVCDFDDTLVESHMEHALRAAWTAMTGDPARLDPVDGMRELLQRLAAGEGQRAAVAYLSGSPVNFHPRIKAYLEQKDFPRGPLLLRNLGLGPDNESWSLSRYKSREIRRLMKIFPDSRFVLVGDSGQSDPEIYRELQQEAPGRVAAILIRRLEGEDGEERFKGMITFRDGKDGLKAAREAGVIQAGGE